MDASGALEYMYGLQLHGIKLGLENTYNLLDRIGNPHDSFKSVHVAGTNGKGSVCAMCASILQDAGYSTGLYTSPHLLRFNERVQVDGKEITDSEMTKLAEELRGHAEAMREREMSVTFFEFTTALAFAHFANAGADYVVAEVGMGGRLDATNVLRPDVCGITDIGLEHQKYLGETLAEIAGEKAGIIKNRVPVVTSAKERAASVVMETADRLEAPAWLLGRDLELEVSVDDIDGLLFDVRTRNWEHTGLKTPLIGYYQAENAAVAVGMMDVLEIEDDHIRSGLKRVRWPARFDILWRDPYVVLDCAHNLDGAVRLAAAVNRYFPNRRKILLVGMLDDKDWRGFCKVLAPLFEKAVCTRPDSERALDPKLLAGHISGEDEVVENPGMAYDRAMSMLEKDDLLVVAGSVYLAGEVLGLSGRY